MKFTPKFWRAVIIILVAVPFLGFFFYELRQDSIRKQRLYEMGRDMDKEARALTKKHRRILDSLGPVVDPYYNSSDPDTIIIHRGRPRTD